MPPDPDRPTAVIETLMPRLRARARRLSRQPVDAEDMAQETVLRLLQRMRRSPVHQPEHYAMTVLHNVARARWRMPDDTVVLEDDSARTAPVADARLALDTLHRAIAALPPAQAQVMALLLEGEQSPRAIAARLGVPTGTVMSRLARARAQLRRDLGLAQGAPVSELL